MQVAPGLRAHGARPVGGAPARTRLENRLRRDSFTSVDDLEQAIAQYIEHHNKNPKPFIWTASADDILAKVTRAKAALARVGR